LFGNQLGIVMQWLNTAFHWFSGGSVQYHTLRMCMQNDTPWIVLTALLDLAVAVGYVVIAYHWFKNQQLLPPSPARSALATMRNIFAFCGVCGYLFIPIKLFWPAWRLYDCFMVALVFYTWRYALNTKNLKVIYTAVGRSNKLAEDLAESREESKRKSFFLNAISHDLRTPLNGLMLSANLAEMHVAAGDTAGAHQSLVEIQSSVRLTSELLDGLLEYARLETESNRVERENFELDDLLRDVLNSHAAMAAAKSIAITTGIRTGLTLGTDRLKLERILNNLLGNAIKFTIAGSVRIEAEALKTGIEIRVIDTGIGVSPEHRDRLFEEFFQGQNDARDRSKGFGLGLAISRRLASQLGGELRLDSTSAKGSCFAVVIPNVINAGKIASLPGRPPANAAAIAGTATGAAG
jgi:signal transduction histidine kinase